MNGNLNPDQFFHGTTHDITDGMVRPADAVNKPVSEYSFGDPGDMSQGDHAFASRNDEQYAWHAAQSFHPGQGRARVYQVAPAKDMVPGPWNKDHPDFLHHVGYGDPKEYPPHENPEAHQEALNDHQDEWASKTGWPVTGRIDTKPGRQGTFPQVNWNEFSKSTVVNAHMDANHPNDDQRVEGMHYASNRKEIDRAWPKPRARNLREFMDARPETLEPPVNQRGQGKLF
jgi:hypothetical protein